MSLIYKPLKIFLAEDDEDDREFFYEALHSIRPDAELIVVNNGEKVLEFFKEQSAIPNLVFLDINMPKKDGIECLKFIKSAYPHGDFPIIMLSTSSAKHVVEQSLHHGASLYIQKPSRFSELVNYLEYCLTHLKNNAVKGSFLLNNWPESKIR